MISLNVHSVEEVEVGKTDKIFEDSYCRTIRIKTNEVDLVEIYLFAAKAEILDKVKGIKPLDYNSEIEGEDARCEL